MERLFRKHMLVVATFLDTEGILFLLNNHVASTIDAADGWMEFFKLQQTKKISFDVRDVVAIGPNAPGSESIDIYVLFAGYWL
jgi:hypothetical protein